MTTEIHSGMRAGKQVSTSSSRKFEQPSRPDLIIKVCASRGYKLYVVAIHLAALSAVWLPALTPHGLQSAFSSGSVATLPWQFSARITPLLLYNSWRMRSGDSGTLHWHNNNHVEMNASQQIQNSQTGGSLTQRSLHCYFFVLLEWQQANGKLIQYVIARDAVSTADYRRLRTRLYLNSRISPPIRY